MPREISSTLDHDAAWIMTLWRLLHGKMPRPETSRRTSSPTSRNSCPRGKDRLESSRLRRRSALSRSPSGPAKIIPMQPMPSPTTTNSNASATCSVTTPTTSAFITTTSISRECSTASIVPPSPTCRPLPETRAGPSLQVHQPSAESPAPAPSAWAGEFLSQSAENFFGGKSRNAGSLLSRSGKCSTYPVRPGQIM